MIKGSYAAISLRVGIFQKYSNSLRAGRHLRPFEGRTLVAPSLIGASESIRNLLACLEAVTCYGQRLGSGKRGRWKNNRQRKNKTMLTSVHGGHLQSRTIDDS